MISPKRHEIPFTTRNVVVEDLKKPIGFILTGIGYLDHMIDQFNSHAQIGTCITVCDSVESINVDIDEENRNRYGESDQYVLLNLVGGSLGSEFQRLIKASPKIGTSSTFACPLDEALVECTISFDPDHGKLTTYTLTPFGSYPATGRKKVGHMKTDALFHFFEALAKRSDLKISLCKIRGNNAHHIVESSFKAFSRALRNLLDGVSCNVDNECIQILYGPKSDNYKAGVEQQRQGLVSRKTKETSIDVNLKLDGGRAGINVATGIATLDMFFTTLAEHADLSLDLSCTGDLWIDEHHTAEDVSIAAGQCLDKALGTKAGLNRMWCSTQQEGASRVQVTMDLSNRPCFHHNLSLNRPDTEMIEDLSIEMFEHVLDSLVVNAKTTLHVVELDEGSLHDTVKATAMAFGESLKYCAMVDLRRSGATASSKGTLSV